MAGRKKGFDPTVKLSKALSYLLRHGAEKEGFKLLPGGFLYVDEILRHKNFGSASVEDIQRVVETNDKKRFTLEVETETGWLKIRANQGHSLQVHDLDLKPITDSAEYPIVIHGTYHTAFNLIAKQGLKRMQRNHIHFATGEPGKDGIISGMRNSCTIVIYLNLAKALEDGIKFYLSANNVILCPGNEDGVIPVTYFDKVIDRQTGQRIAQKNLTSLQSESCVNTDKADGHTDKMEEASVVTADNIKDECDKKKKKKRQMKSTVD